MYPFLVLVPTVTYQSNICFLDNVSTTSQASSAATDTVNESKPSNTTFTPTTKFDEAILALENKSTQWEALIEALSDIKDIATYHPTIFHSNAGTATSLVIRHCNSIRSRISGAAIEVLKDLFRFLKKKLIPNLNEAVTALIVEACKENVFIREKCDKCLLEIVDSMVGANQKLIGSLSPHVRSKHQVARTLGSRFLHVSIEKMGLQKSLIGNATTVMVSGAIIVIYILVSLFAY